MAQKCKYERTMNAILSLSLSLYIYIYIYICVCVCVCVYIYIERDNRVHCTFRYAFLCRCLLKVFFVVVAAVVVCFVFVTSFSGLLHFTLDPYLIMMRLKQGGIKYNFFSLWYDSTWYWTAVSRAIGKHSTMELNQYLEHLLQKYAFIFLSQAEYDTRLIFGFDSKFSFS